jgi:hypothetical protein
MDVGRRAVIRHLDTGRWSYVDDREPAAGDRRKESLMNARIASAEMGAVELDYVAVCIAEQIVRIKISAVRRKQGNEQAHDTSPVLTRPLTALASTLGIRRQVEALVADALPGAIV